MLWAFEDAMYGQVWHWDPVQTAVFVPVVPAGAHLHGINGWGVGRRHWRMMPLAAVLAAAAVPCVMAVTRNPVLASRTATWGRSWWHMVRSAAVLLVLALVAAFSGRGAGARACGRGARSSAGLGLWLAQLCFLGAAAVAVVQLLLASAAAVSGAPRPEEYKPFAMPANLVSGGELERCARPSSSGTWTAMCSHAASAVAGRGGLAGGWYFFRRISVGAGRLSLLAALAVTGRAQPAGRLMTRHHEGAGILSQQIVALLPQFDAVLAGCAYLALGGGAWTVFMVHRHGLQDCADLPLLAIHAGSRWPFRRPAGNRAEQLLAA